MAQDAWENFSIQYHPQQKWAKQFPYHLIASALKEKLSVIVLWIVWFVWSMFCLFHINIVRQASNYNFNLLPDHTLQISRTEDKDPLQSKLAILYTRKALNFHSCKQFQSRTSVDHSSHYWLSKLYTAISSTSIVFSSGNSLHCLHTLTRWQVGKTKSTWVKSKCVPLGYTPLVL